MCHSFFIWSYLISRIMSSLNADLHQALRILFHSRFLTILSWLILVLFFGFYLSIQFSARQLSTVSLDIGLSIIRLALPLITVLMAQELFSREFERKLYLTSFTYPRARSCWLMGRVLAMLAVGLAILIVMGSILAGLSAYAETIYHQATPVALGTPYLITLASIALDLLIVVAVASLLAVSARTPSFVLIGTLGFVLICRSYTPIVELLRSNPYVVSDFVDPRLYQDSLSLLVFILPDLGRLDVRMIALYNDMAFLPTDWPLLLISILAYAGALLGLSVWVLNKREFS